MFSVLTFSANFAVLSDYQDKKFLQDILEIEIRYDGKFSKQVYINQQK